MRLVDLFRARPRVAAVAELRAVQRSDRPTAQQRPSVPNWAQTEMDPPEQARDRRQQRTDAAIVAAQARGEFDNLRGKGKPIPAEQLVSSDEAWLAGKVLANSGFLPPWLQLQHEIEEDLAECRRRVERAERFPPLANRQLPLEDLRSRLDDIRAKTRRFNLMAPSMSLQRPVPKTEDLLLRMALAVNVPLDG